MLKLFKIKNDETWKPPCNTRSRVIESVNLLFDIYLHVSKNVDIYICAYVKK